MKNLKLFAAGAMLALSAGAFAQDIKTDLANFEKIVIKNDGKPEAYKAELKQLDKTYKKDANALGQIARMFYNNDDTLNARVYAEKSIALVDKSKGKLKEVEGMLVLGDLFYNAGDPGEAAGWYERAKATDDLNAIAYEKVAGVYRKANPAAAVENLKELTKLDPTYPANAVAAGFYYDAAYAGQKTWGKTLEYFQKEDVTKLREVDFPRYVYVLYLYSKYEKCIEIAEMGLAKFPEDVACNRYRFWSLQALDKNDEAISAAQKLYACPKYKAYAADFRIEGQAYCGLKDYAKAEEVLNKSLALDAEQPEILKSLSDIESGKGNKAKALELMQQYLEKYEKADFRDYLGLVSKYDDVIKEALTQEDKAQELELTKKQDEVLAKMLEKFPGQQLVYIYNKRANTNSVIDPTGAASAVYYEKFIEAAKAEDATKYAGHISRTAQKLVDFYTAQGNTEKAAVYSAMVQPQQ